MKVATDLRIWLRFVTLLAPYKGRLAVTFVATLARPLLNAAKIYLLKLVIDNLAATPTARLALLICAGYVAISLAKGVATFGDQYLGTYVGGRVSIDLRQRLYERFLRLSLRYHSQHRVGESISRLVSDAGAVEEMLIAGITDGATQVVTVVVFAAMLFYLDPLLAAISLTVLPFLFCSLVVYARRSRDAFRDVRVRLADITAAAEEGLSAIALVKSFMRHAAEGARLRERTEQHWLARLVAAKQRAIFVPLSDVVATVGTVLVIFFGARALAAGTLTIGGLVVFLGYLGQMYNPLLSLSRLGNSVQGGLAAAERVAAILDLPPADDEPRAATLRWQELPRDERTAAPALAFESVSFAYQPDQLVLRDFSLAVPRGGIVGVVGESGGGKSSALALLQRLYEPDAGRVCIYGHDLRELDTDTLRDYLAVVPQEVTLLMGTVRENIAYGNPEADEPAILRAARQAGILDLGLPAGLDTLIGPRGTRLSGGQRQRVALARALVRQAPLLLLDEVTSALDTLSEERLRATLSALRGRHTMLVVAHRLSTVRDADAIAVVREGRVVEVGRHAELLARGGAYAELVRAQESSPEGGPQASERAGGQRAGMPATATANGGSEPLAHESDRMSAFSS